MFYEVFLRQIKFAAPFFSISTVTATATLLLLLWLCCELTAGVQFGTPEASLKDLLKEIIEYRLTAEEQVYPSCGDALHEMSTETWREIKIIPAQALVVNHVSYVYACRRCERDGNQPPIITAAMPMFYTAMGHTESTGT